MSTDPVRLPMALYAVLWLIVGLLCGIVLNVKEVERVLQDVCR